MAMSVPKSGYSRFLKEGAQYFKGTDEAVIRNIDACVDLASQIRSAYGPNGMNKMVINHIEKLFVTNDAATILKELEIQHPAARMIIMASEMQEKQVGDNTNTVVIFASALLENAALLINMGLTPVEVADGYEQAAEKALEILPSLVVQEAKDLKDLNLVKQFLRSAITSKQYDNEDIIAELVAKACVQTVPKNSFNFNVDNIRVCKILGSGVGASTVMNGMVFRRGAETDLKSVEKARVAIFSCPFDLTQTETKGTVLIESASELMGYAQGEESEVESQIKALADNGVSVVVAAGKFGDLYIHFLNKYKIMGCAPPVNLLGECERVYVTEIGDTEVVVFDKQSELGNVATVIVRGSSQSRMDDVERAIDDAVNTYKALTKDARLLAGAGAVEVELARRIEKIGETCPGLEQYAIKKFAHSLEVLPKAIAENAGHNATELLTRLYAAHETNQPTAGVDVVGGGIIDANAAHIYDLFSGKELAIKLATNAAVTILKVDQMNDIESAVQRIYTNESDHKAQIEQLLGLLNPLFPVDASAAFDVAPIVKLVGAVVRVEQGSMLVSRNLVQSIVARLEPPMPRDVMKKLGNQLIEVTQARSISYEEQTSALRLKLSSIADAEGSFLEAAEHLLAIPLETGQRPYSADFKMSTYLRVAELCLEGGDIDKAETYVNRASMLQNETEDETLNIRHKSVYARVLDMRGRFIEAAQRYYELSGRVGLTISEKREALQRALTCTILASPSPSRTRLLNQLVKDERVHGLPAFGLLEKLYAEKLIKQEERGLLPHQRHLGGEKGETTGEADRTLLGKAVVEHNIQAAGKLYNNISFDTLAELLGVGVEKAEKTASKMISEKRLKAHIDQVDKYLHFEEHSPLEQWDGEIARLCAEASRVVQMITAAHPEFIAGLEQ